MLRHGPRPDTATTISDRELGLAAMLLLVAVVLTSLIVPALA
jgi:hypothetical protein